MDGLILLNKEQNITSQGAVNRIKRLFGASKAGHTGTLDPMATGVLPILIGRGVKASEFMLTSTKHYEAHLTLGQTSDTEDIWGEVLSRSDALPTDEEFFAVLDRFRGEILQTPPMYSALKVGGKKLCDLARSGVVIDRTPRPITVHSLTARRIDERTFALDVVCSKGTYIRTLCADIGAALGCGGVMSALCRTEASGYPIAKAHTLAQLEAMSQEERRACVLPVEDIFRDLPALTLLPFFSRLAHAGLEIYEKKIGTALPLGTRVRLCDSDGFFAVGEVREYEDGLAIKPIRQF